MDNFSRGRVNLAGVFELMQLVSLDFELAEVASAHEAATWAQRILGTKNSPIRRSR
jgi:hypothetical protein